MRDIVRQIAVLLSTLGVIAVNGIANALPLNGQTTGEISDRFDVYFVPAGYVFSIWGLIYLGLLAYTIYQVLPSQRENPRLRRTGWLYVLSCAANVAWLFLWHYEVFAFSLLAMGVLMLSLIAIYLLLDTGRSWVPVAETWLARIPFSIYLGWITVATIANVTSLLDYLGWGGWGISPEAWAIIVLLVGTVITSAVSITRGDVAYVAVIIWAFIGIAVKHSDTPLVAIPAGFAAGFVLGTLLLGVPRTQQQLPTWVAREEQVGVRDRW